VAKAKFPSHLFVNEKELPEGADKFAIGAPKAEDCENGRIGVYVLCKTLVKSTKTILTPSK